jgi:formamidopyrimidine-DNA glycosylase
MHSATHRLASVQRSGKEIEFLFSNKAALFVHLMLSGRFSIVTDPDSIKFKVLTMIFDDGASLVVSDPKKLVTIKLNPVPSTVPDALEVNGAYLRKKYRRNQELWPKHF